MIPDVIVDRARDAYIEGGGDMRKVVEAAFDALLVVEEFSARKADCHGCRQLHPTREGAEKYAREQGTPLETRFTSIWRPLPLT